jgi:hypothetical protein
MPGSPDVILRSGLIETNPGLSAAVISSTPNLEKHAAAERGDRIVEIHLLADYTEGTDRKP